MKKIMNIYLFLILFSVFCNSVCYSQDIDTLKFKKQGQHTIFVELFGHAGLWCNIAYDYTLTLKGRHKIAFAFGAIYFPHIERDYSSKNKVIGSHFSFSPQISYLYGKKHHLELGIGFISSFQYSSSHKIKNRTDLVIPLNIGYRYQRDTGGFWGKIGYMPIYIIRFELFEDRTLWPFWGGISIGYTFKNKK